MNRKNIKNLITEYFFLYPTAKLRVRELERTLRLPLPSIIRYCRELEQEGILAIHKTGNVAFYTASRSDVYLLEKKLFNIRQLFESGLVKYLKVELSNPTIVLFGSYARGEDTEDSDIDIYIETPSEKQINIEKFKNALKRNLQIFRHKGIREIKNSHLANNIINGIPLNNHMEVFR